MVNSQTTPTGGKMPFDSQDEYEKACREREGKPMTTYQPETTQRKGDYVKMNDILHTLPLHKGLLHKFVKNMEIETGGEDLSEFVLDCLERAWIETMADAAQARAERLRRLI